MSHIAGSVIPIYEYQIGNIRRLLCGWILKVCSVDSVLPPQQFLHTFRLTHTTPMANNWTGM